MATLRVFARCQHKTNTGDSRDVLLRGTRPTSTVAASDGEPVGCQQLQIVDLVGATLVIPSMGNIRDMCVHVWNRMTAVTAVANSYR